MPQFFLFINISKMSKIITSSIKPRNYCQKYKFIRKRMSLRNFSTLIAKTKSFSRLFQTNKECYTPTFYLTHPFLQSVYNLAEPKIHFNLHRERLFFEDGGHISLDWGESPKEHFQQTETPILFLMHGLTGGSQMNYIKSLMMQAQQQGYRTVCMNSRGINNQMTSPLPFTATSYHELTSALDRIQTYYPKSPIYMVGTSFGGNYLLRYLIEHNRKNIKGLVALAAPFNVKKAVDDMPPIYQKFFVKRYIQETVIKHPQMNYWAKIGLVNMEQILQSQNLRQFHSRLTTKIVGLESVDHLFDHYQISEENINNLRVPTMIITSQDDPIVSFQSIPMKQIEKNKNIELVTTKKGGHLCWFEGIRPKRWYPKPTLDFFMKIRSNMV